jgi:putative transposase
VTQNYRTDLTDSQWHHIKDFFPAPKESGRPREVDFRQVVTAILFLLVTGCQRRMIPLDFPKWQTVYYYFANWKKDGTWFRIHETLRADERARAGKKKHPTAGCLDSQTFKTTAVPSSRGFDAGKKILGQTSSAG